MRALLLGLVLVGTGWLATVAPNPPAPLPAGAPPAEFSAERALAHVRAIARTIHPIASPENAAVRRYLSDQLKDLGLETAVQPFTCQHGQTGGFNLMARIPGANVTNQPARAVALVCHYDSVPTGPGASDDGAAVAALLETARALKAGPALRNDVILLFTDGEEVPGELPGAAAFVKSCPWMNDVGCMFNFDARGVSGPELMYETSAGNGPLIREFARTARRPVADSLMSEVYRHMPNDTDFTVFRRAGTPGLNFAFIGGSQNYHRPTDDVAHLNLNTLQHAGDLALGLARHFGNLDLAALRGPDAVYFDLLGRVIIRYPSTWAIPLALLSAALFIGVAWLAIKRGEISSDHSRIEPPNRSNLTPANRPDAETKSPSPAGAGEGRGEGTRASRSPDHSYFGIHGKVSVWKLAEAALAWGLNLLLVGVIFVYWPELVCWWAHGVPGWLARLQMWPYWFMALGLTTALSTTLQIVLGRWLGPTNLALGALWWWLLLALASAFWMPGGSFLGLWPLIFGLLGVLPMWREISPNHSRMEPSNPSAGKPSDAETVSPSPRLAGAEGPNGERAGVRCGLSGSWATKQPWWQTVWLALTALPTLVLITPLIYEAYVALGPNAAALPMLFFVLVLGALSPQTAAVSRAGKWILPVAGVLVALVAVVLSL